MLLFTVFGMLAQQQLLAQNSVLVNFGSSFCGSGVPSFSMIKNPLSNSPLLLSDCDFSQQVPNYSYVFVAYNPKNNKIYIADNRTNAETKIWLLDAGLPLNISCPPSIPVTPSYSYTYISNNFEFDNNGDLWSFSNYNDTTGQCNMDKFDVNTGNIISTKILQFPAGNFPTTIQSGDLTILPNGRMFAVLGNGICQLYEITNYNTNAATAEASFLTTTPKDCYGISYLNGSLELAGTNGRTNCYYYDYNLATGQLGAEKVFQNGQVPIDNTSFTPSIGCTKRLVSAVKINSNTADLTYEIYGENYGNVILNNVTVTDDLTATFGAGNVSVVSASFIAGSNAAGLSINPAFNGTTVTSILNAGQNMANRVLQNRNYFFKVQVKCRATNLNPSTIYLNTAIASADIGSGDIASRINVSDSSNNGDSTVLDPNKNGNPSDAGENIPTPFVFSTLPVHFIGVTATLINQHTAVIKWQIATPVINGADFVVEFSTDAANWNSIGAINIDDALKNNYSLTHSNIPTGKLYYRIKQTDKDGSITYSKIMALINAVKGNSFVIFPNPANNTLQIMGTSITGTTRVNLFDAVGRKLVDKTITANSSEIDVQHLPAGTYIIQLSTAEESFTEKIIIRH